MTSHLSRRRLILAASGMSAAGLLAACSDDTPDIEVPSGTIPEETAGPFPADGSNGPNVLTENDVVRADIRKSIGSATGSADGVTLDVSFRVLNVSNGSGEGLAGAAVYAWHCDREGRYSMYADGIESENYLRGVQVADADGQVTFTTVFPGCYPGRWPHIHLEVFPTLEQAKNSAGRLRTTQMAFPEAACEKVYSQDGYSDSARHLKDISLSDDGVFRDGHSLQMATVDGNATDKMTASLNLPV